MPGNKLKLLITGGLGNLGSWITDHFSAGGKHEVSVLTKMDRALNIDPAFKKIFCDITDKEALDKVLTGSEFDYIIHLASLNETFLDDYPRQALMINAYGTRNILEVCSDKKVKKFIYLSTFHVYGKDGGLITEKDEVSPQNDYAITHLFAEEYIKLFSKKNGLPYIIFRLSNSYGCPKDTSSSKWYLLFNDLCKQAVEQKQIEMRTNGTPLRDFIYMNDVSLAIEKVLDREDIKNEIFNLGSGSSLSLLEIAELVASAYKEMYDREIVIKRNSKDTGSYATSLDFSIDKLKAAIAFEPSFCFKEEAKKIFTLLKSQHR